MALKCSEKERAAFESAVREGLADSAAGRMVPYETVRRWVLSWGSESELSLSSTACIGSEE
jgi:predicted transcriptional regulator